MTPERDMENKHPASAFPGHGLLLCVLALAFQLQATFLAHASTSQTTVSVDDRQDARRTPVVDVFERSGPAVVNISTTEIINVRGGSPFDLFFNDFFSRPTPDRRRQYTRASVGSGFIIHADGYLVTNAHVVAGTSEQKVIFADGREFDAAIIAADVRSDLAILKIDAEEPLPVLSLGRSHDLLIGETAIAIGNPFGYENTVTAGVVSAVGREVVISEELVYEDLIQTDASINPGNSGGPLLNVYGDLIGVNSAIRGGAQNIGFAIPADQLRTTLHELLDVERRYRMTVGMSTDPLDVPRVLSVEENSPADDAGIRPGDLLRSLDGRAIGSGIDVTLVLLGMQAGDTLRIVLERGNRTQAVALVLGEMEVPDGDALASTMMGIRVSPVTTEDARRRGLSRLRGLVVDWIEPGGPAAKAGFKQGDILVAVDTFYPGDADELGDHLAIRHGGDMVQVRILRLDGLRKVQLSGPLRLRDAG